MAIPPRSRRTSSPETNRLRQGKAYQTSKISETAQDTAKVRLTINGLYKAVYEVSIAGKSYD